MDDEQSQQDQTRLVRRISEDYLNREKRVIGLLPLPRDISDLVLNYLRRSCPFSVELSTYNLKLEGTQVQALFALNDSSFCIQRSRSLALYTSGFNLVKSIPVMPFSTVLHSVQPSPFIVVAEQWCFSVYTAADLTLWRNQETYLNINYASPAPALVGQCLRYRSAQNVVFEINLWTFKRNRIFDNNLRPSLNSYLYLCVPNNWIARAEQRYLRFYNSRTSNVCELKFEKQQCVHNIQSISAEEADYYLLVTTCSRIKNDDCYYLLTPETFTIIWTMSRGDISLSPLQFSFSSVFAVIRRQEENQLLLRDLQTGQPIYVVSLPILSSAIKHVLVLPSCAMLILEDGTVKTWCGTDERERVDLSQPSFSFEDQSFRTLREDRLDSFGSS